MVGITPCLSFSLAMMEMDIKVVSAQEMMGLMSGINLNRKPQSRSAHLQNPDDETHLHQHAFQVRSIPTLSSSLRVTLDVVQAIASFSQHPVVD